MVHLVTGYAGRAHIKSEDDGAFNASFVGSDQYVMEFGNCFEATIIDNNTVRLSDGNGMMYGRYFRIEPNAHEDVTIDNGTSGKNRIDLICAVYRKNTSTGVETLTLDVIKGTETTGTATTPKYTNGDILQGATLNQMPLYKVKINGVVLKEVIPMFKKVQTFKKMAEKYEAEFQEEIEKLKSENILDSLDAIKSNTEQNKIAGATALKELVNKMEELENYIGSDLLGGAS